MALRRRTGRALSAALALAACAVPSLAAQVEPSTATEQELEGHPNVVVAYYEVRGKSFRQLRRQLDALGPTDAEGRRWAGHALAEFTYGWSVGRDGACNLSKAQVSYRITVVLPRLAPGVKLEPRTAEWWRAARHNLTVHEMDHARLALGYARELEASIKSATCATAKAAAERTLQAFREANAAYDARTAHGLIHPSGPAAQASP